MIQTWFKLFFRISKKNWLNTVINVSGLTLGIVGLIIVLLYYNDEKSYDQWNTEKDTVYKVVHKWSDGQVYDSTTDPEGPKSKEVIPEIIDFLRVESYYSEQILSYENNTIFETKIIGVNKNYFDFFPHPILKGNQNEILATPNSVAISTTVEKQLFGDKESIGKVIKFGSRDYIVTAVYELQTPSVIEPQVLVHKRPTTNNNWGGFTNYTFYKIKEGADIAQVEKKLYDVFVDNYYKGEAAKDGITIQAYVDREGSIPKLEPLEDLRLHTIGNDGLLEGKGNYLLLLIMMGLSILIIVISSINFINLSIVSASQRAKEVGVKKTLGVSKIRLRLQFILEILIQGILSLLIALVIVELILPVFNIFFGKKLSLGNLEVLSKVSILTIVISLIIGIVSALYVSNFKTINVLKGNISRSRSMVFARNLMLGLQFVISGFFFIGGLVVYAQVNYMGSKKLGFSGEHILVVNFNNNQSPRWKNYQLLKSVFLNDPDIESISTSYQSPGVDEDISLDIEYLDKVVDTKFIGVDFGHLEMIKTELITGRYLSEQFTSDTINSIIFNETAAKRLGLINDPLNKEVLVDDQKFNVVGIIKDYHLSSLDEEIRPVFYTHNFSIRWFKGALNTVHFKIKPENTENTVAEIERFWTTRIEPGYPFSFYFLDEKYNKTHDIYRKQQRLFFILTIVVIFIALLGLFALATLTIQQRLKEVAIRKTLGASVKEIVIQLIKSFLKITIVASLVLLPIAYYLMQNWLNNFAYRIEMPFWPYIFAPLVLLILVFVVVGLKAFNATKVDLIKYLKFE
ncbi:FtsX-like permease family protein [Flavobacteriaceae bacterium R38]|nr:FtsX-like permease family protein [Flavobacteriaceae bacterium R38]